MPPVTAIILLILLAENIVARTTNRSSITFIVFLRFISFFRILRYIVLPHFLY